VTDKKQKCEVARKDSTVVVAINCDDDYAAMLLYDKICNALKSGRLELELTVNATV
jgi:hypothetical protein